MEFSAHTAHTSESDRDSFGSVGIDVARVRDGQFVEYRFGERGTQFDCSIRELPGPDRGRQFDIVSDAQTLETFPMSQLLARPQLDLTLDHAQDVRRDASVKPQTSFGRRNHVTVQPFTYRFD